MTVDLTDVTLTDEDTNSTLTDEAIILEQMEHWWPNLQAMQVAPTIALASFQISVKKVSPATDSEDVYSASEGVRLASIKCEADPQAFESKVVSKACLIWCETGLSKNRP